MMQTHKIKWGVAPWMVQAVLVTLVFLSMAGVVGALSSRAQAAPVTKFETLTQAQVEQTYFFDWNRNVKFRAALMRAFAQSKVAMPAWVRQGSGPSAPSKVVHQGNVHWAMLNTCKSRDCGNNILYVAFDPATLTTSAVGKINGKLTWIGATGPVREALSRFSGL